PNHGSFTLRPLPMTLISSNAQLCDLHPAARKGRKMASLPIPGLLVLGAILVTGSAHATTLCVNPGGTGGCTATIQAAVDAAAKGDVIDVAAGTYVETVQIPGEARLTLHGA